MIWIDNGGQLGQNENYIPYPIRAYRGKGEAPAPTAPHHQ